MHCVPTSIAGEYLMARADVRQNGCRADVKAMARPEATAQEAMENSNELFDSVPKHAGVVMKLLPRGLPERQAVALQRPIEMRVAQPCFCQQLFDNGNYLEGSYGEQQNDCRRQCISSDSSSMNETRRTRQNINRAQEQYMLANNDGSMPANPVPRDFLLIWHPSDKFATHDGSIVLR